MLFAAGTLPSQQYSTATVSKQGIGTMQNGDGHRVENVASMAEGRSKKMHSRVVSRSKINSGQDIGEAERLPRSSSDLAQLAIPLLST